MNTGLNTRITLYALLSAFEKDMRNHFLFYCEKAGKDQLFSSSFFKQAKDLAHKREGLDLTSEEYFPIIPDYMNFGDTLNFMLSSKAKLGGMPFASGYKNFSERLSGFVAIRNRVMHGRPLDFEDYESVVSLSKTLVNEQETWESLYSTLCDLRNSPNRFLDLAIPFEETPNNHNLPLPDFDETGFIGRQDFLLTFSKLLKGPYPVITIIGEGGIGKTASTLKACYDFYDSNPSFFDRIIWVTAKSANIGLREVVEIKDSIKTSLEMFTEISRDLAPGSSGDPYKEILEYLKEFKILLVLDNLETVLDERIKDFLAELPAGSKVIITSRIGVGNSEHRIKLPPLSTPECVKLLKKLCSFRGITQLESCSYQKLEDYTKKLYCNPGFIKWFAALAALGKTPESIFKESGVFIDFCMSNVYSFVSDKAKRVLSCMQALQSDLSLAEIAVVEEIEPEDVESAILELCNTNMVYCKHLKGDGNSAYVYALNPISRGFLLKNHPLQNRKVSSYQSKYRNILAVDERLESTRHPFYRIRASTNEEKIVSVLLSRAIEATEKDNLEAASKALEKAKALAPGFSEVYRIESHLKTKMGDIDSAEACLDKALELKPGCGFLHYTLGRFQIRFRDALDKADSLFRVALEKEPLNPYIILEVSKCLMRLKQFKRAEDLLKTFPKCGSVSPRNRIKYFDCLIDLKVREAEVLFESKDFSGFILRFNDALNIWSIVPQNLKDRKMAENMLFKRHRLTFILRHSLDKEVVLSASESLKRLEAV